MKIEEVSMSKKTRTYIKPLSGKIKNGPLSFLKKEKLM